MVVHDLADDREAEATAAGRPAARGVRAPEPVEYPGQVLRPDTRAGVRDLYRGHRFIVVHPPIDPHEDRSAGSRGPYRIADEVAEHLPEPVGVRDDRQVRVDGDAQVD